MDKSFRFGPLCGRQRFNHIAWRLKVDVDSRHIQMRVLSLEIDQIISKVLREVLLGLWVLSKSRSLSH